MRPLCLRRPDMGKYAKDINIHVYDLIRFFDEGAK